MGEPSHHSPSKSSVVRSLGVWKPTFVAPRIPRDMFRKDKDSLLASRRPSYAPTCMRQESGIEVMIPVASVLRRSAYGSRPWCRTAIQTHTSDKDDLHHTCDKSLIDTLGP